MRRKIFTTKFIESIEFLDVKRPKLFTKKLRGIGKLIKTRNQMLI